MGGGFLLFCSEVLESLHDGMAPGNPTTGFSSADSDHEIRLQGEWARVEGTYGLLRPRCGEDVVYIHRQTTQRFAMSPDPWEPISVVFLARSCLGQVPGGAPFSQRSELATACTSRMQIKN